MNNNLGYTKLLFILPFDHRGSFVKGLFGADESNLTVEIEDKVREYKQIIYQGFKKAVESEVPKEFAGILVDEQFGDEILKDAKMNGYITILTTEKSGQKEFTFEYGDDFGKHIDLYQPVFAKVLLRYNTEDPQDSKDRQRVSLKRLTDFCHENGYKFLCEVLISPTESQAARFGGDKDRFDREERPRIAAKMMEEFQDFGVEPDIWKMEGVDTKEDYELMINSARKNGRDEVGLVVLGRGAGREQVDKWISEGAKVQGVNGFAVGRTIFWEPLVEFKDGKISKEEAGDKIKENYIYYFKLFNSTRQGL